MSRHSASIQRLKRDEEKTLVCCPHSTLVVVAVSYKFPRSFLFLSLSHFVPHIALNIYIHIFLLDSSTIPFFYIFFFFIVALWFTARPVPWIVMRSLVFFYFFLLLLIVNTDFFYFSHLPERATGHCWNIFQNPGALLYFFLFSFFRHLILLY